jgi:hypothetical protein
MNYQVWQEFDMRMMAKSTSKMDFFDKNREMAEGLAIQEFADAKEKMKETQVISILPYQFSSQRCHC